MRPFDGENTERGVRIHRDDVRAAAAALEAAYWLMPCLRSIVGEPLTWLARLNDMMGEDFLAITILVERRNE